MLPKDLLQARACFSRILAPHKESQRRGEKGVAHAALLFFAVLVAAVTVGGLAWMTYKMSQESQGSSQSSQNRQDSAPRTVPSGMPSLPNPADAGLEPELVATQTRQGGSCDSFDIAGVKLGMSSKQAKAAIIQHFNLSPQTRAQWEGKFEEAPNFFAYPEDWEGAVFSKKRKRAYSEAELERILESAPKDVLLYDFGDDDCASPPGSPSVSPKLCVMFLPVNPINLAHPEKAVHFQYEDNALTVARVKAIFAAFGPPTENPDATQLGWKNVSCSSSDGNESLVIEFREAIRMATSRDMEAGDLGPNTLLVMMLQPKGVFPRESGVNPGPAAAIAWKKAKGLDTGELEAYAEKQGAGKGKDSALFPQMGEGAGFPLSRE